MHICRRCVRTLGFHEDLAGGSGLTLTGFWNYMGILLLYPIRCRPHVLGPASRHVPVMVPTFRSTQRRKLTWRQLCTSIPRIRSIYRLAMTRAICRRMTILRTCTFNSRPTTSSIQLRLSSMTISPPGGAKPHAFYTSTASPEINPNGTIVNFVITKNF